MLIPRTKSRLYVAALATLLLSTAALADDATGSFSRNLTVSGAPQIEIRTGSGNINVRTGSGDRVVVEGRIKANDNWGSWFGGSHLSADERVKRIEANPPIEQNGSSIVIGKIEDEELRNNVSISYDVTVPPSTKLDSHSGSGSQRIEDIKGPVRANTGSGTIEIGQIGDEVDAQAGSGNVKIAGANGNVTARTGSGHITLHNIKSGLRASTGSGGIEADGEARKDWDLHTGSGSINVRTPTSAGFRVDAETGSGGVTIDKPLTMQGSISRHHIEGNVGNGGPTMRLRTGSGGIHIE